MDRMDATTATNATERTSRLGTIARTTSPIEKWIMYKLYEMSPRKTNGFHSNRTTLGAETSTTTSATTIRKSGAPNPTARGTAEHAHTNQPHPANNPALNMR